MGTTTAGNNPNQTGEQMSANSFVKLRKLTTKDGEPIEEILHRAAEQMRGFTEEATIQLRLIRVDETAAKRVYSMQLTPTGALLEIECLTEPTLVVITTAKTFRHIAEGSYSPVQAYLDGRLHVQGDVGLGKRVILHLAGSGANVNVCPLLDAEIWQADGNGRTGSLTVSGFNFTPGGRVIIRYNFPEEISVPESFVADSRGRFTRKRNLLTCGGVVKVSAFDIESGQNLITGDVSYSAPC